jgi:flagellar hook-basal body complex protein FliE
MEISAIGAGSFIPTAEPTRPAATGSGGKVFGDIVEQVLAGQSKADASANQAIEALATGQAENLHAVSLAVAQADLSFHLVLELRNRITEAYQEVMRMQV